MASSSLHKASNLGLIWELRRTVECQALPRIGLLTRSLNCMRVKV